MSKSLNRVRAALKDAGLETEVRETALARTAQDAAQALGCTVDQIAKSIIFRGDHTGDAVLFLTAGGNRVDASKAEHLAGEPLGRADAALVRAQTGFAIGGVAPCSVTLNNAVSGRGPKMAEEGGQKALKTAL